MESYSKQWMQITSLLWSAAYLRPALYFINFLKNHQKELVEIWVFLKTHPAFLGQVSDQIVLVFHMCLEVFQTSC